MVDFKMVEMSELPQFDGSSPVFCDTETAGLYGEILLAQFFQNNQAYIVLQPNVDELRRFVRENYTAWYNASYDLACIFTDRDDADILDIQVEDLLYLTKQTLLGLSSYSLDNVLDYCGLNLYEGLDKKAMQKSFKSIESIGFEQMQYAAIDVLALSKLWDKVKVATAIQSYKVNILSLKYAIQYQLNGIPVDLDSVNELKAELALKVRKNEESLSFNVNSPKQCKEALGTDSSDEKTLKRLMADNNKTAQLIYEQRRLIKRLIMLESYSFERVYTKFNVAGAASGRFTATGKDIYAGINAQQIPRDLKYLFVSKDMATIEADYSTLELRLAAAMFGDTYMYKQLKNGEDLHTAMAQQMTGRQEITKEERTEAKAINFGFVFGMSAKSFVDYAFYNYGVTFTQEEAIEIRNKYFDMYRNIAQHHNYIWHNYGKQGFYVETALGWKVKPVMGTDAINIPIQGSGAECTKLAIHYMVKEDKSILKHIVNVVHDSIKLEVPKSEVEHYSNFLERNMIKAWQELSKTKAFKFKDIPMLVDVEVKL